MRKFRLQLPMLVFKRIDTYTKNMAEFLPNVDDAEGLNPLDQELGPRNARSVYLITYSQADVGKVKDRNAFARIVGSAFESIGGEVKALGVLSGRTCQWRHALPLALKLQTRHRWLQVKQYLEDRHAVTVHFSDVHVSYYSAWRYVTKSDDAFLQSDGHPDLTDSISRTMEASRKRKEGAQGTPTNNKTKKRRLSAFDVSQIIRAKNIKNETELLALAEEQRLVGENHLAEFIVNRGSKWVSDTLKVILSEL